MPPCFCSFPTSRWTLVCLGADGPVRLHDVAALARDLHAAMAGGCFKEERAITWQEHQIEREQNPERRVFYQLAWHLGASQSDLAFMEAGNMDWEHQVISFARKKTGSIALRRFGNEVTEVLRSLPSGARYSLLANGSRGRSCNQVPSALPMDEASKA
jgi:hypothetical protein